MLVSRIKDYKHVTTRTLSNSCMTLAGHLHDTFITFAGHPHDTCMTDASQQLEHIDISASTVEDVVVSRPIQECCRYALRLGALRQYHRVCFLGLYVGV